MSFTIRLGEDLEDRIAKLAERAGRSKSFLAKQAINEKLEELEDYYLAVDRLKEYDPKDNRSLSEVMAMYGLED